MLLTVVVLPALFVAVGYAFLVCGVAYEHVRELVAPADAAPVAALLVGGYWLLPADPVGGLPWATGAAVELGFTLLFGVAFGLALGVLYTQGTSLADLAPRHWVVLLVAALGLVGLATDLTGVQAVGDLLLVVALAAAVVGYDRTRSVWVPVASLAVFELTLAATVYAEAVLGLATM